MVTTLSVLLFCLKALEAVCVLVLVTIAVDLGWYLNAENQSEKPKQPKTPRHFDPGYFMWKWEAKRIETRCIHSEQERKAQIREAKEAAAWASPTFFDGVYVRGFDSQGNMFYRGNHIPRHASWEYYKTMDDLADTEILNTSEEF